jgi:hypothetical protein
MSFLSRAMLTRVKSIMQALHSRRTKSKTMRSIPSARRAGKSIIQSLHRTKTKTIPSARRAVNAMHTRSQGERPDPPVRLQTPRLRIEPAQYGIREARFHCGACVEFLPDGTRLDLAASSLEESTLEGAGRGLIVKQYVPPNTKYSEYGGEVVDERVARSRRAKVILFVVCLVSLKY